MNLKTGQMTLFLINIFVIFFLTSLTFYLIKKLSYNCSPEGLDCERKRCMLGVKDNPSINNILKDLSLPRIMLDGSFSNPQVIIYNICSPLANYQP